MKMNKFEETMNTFDSENSGKYYEILSITNYEKNNKIYMIVCVRSREELPYIPPDD